jgi:5-methylcytosine-specific restriction protein A
MCPSRKSQARDRDRDRTSASQRGYDHAWRKFRIGYLGRHPLCADCLERGVVRPVYEVHHLRKVTTNPKLRLVDANLRSLCTPCHAVRTARRVTGVSSRPRVSHR